MILILGGTSDSVSLARLLHKTLIEKIPAMRITVTGATKWFIPEQNNNFPAEIHVLREQLSPERLSELIIKSRVVIDATHPFACGITSAAVNACGELQVPYIRYERPSFVQSIGMPLHVHTAKSHTDACSKALELTKKNQVIGLTIGTRSLSLYVQRLKEMSRMLMVRVLPVPESVSAALECGVPMNEIIAMKGPVSTTLETAFLKHWNVSVLITKDSGSAGGVSEKIAATEAVGIPLIIVERPRADYSVGIETTFEGVAARVRAAVRG